MPQHPTKPVPSMSERRSARGTAPKTGKLPPGSEGQPSSPRIGVTIVKRGA
jgi:hypothetical protein